MIWYMFGICLVYKNDQKFWPWLKLFDQILLIMVYKWYTKNIWNTNCHMAFFVTPIVCLIPEATRNDFFHWYTTGIWHDGVHITTFFICYVFTPLKLWNFFDTRYDYRICWIGHQILSNDVQGPLNPDWSHDMTFSVMVKKYLPWPSITVHPFVTFQFLLHIKKYCTTWNHNNLWMYIHSETFPFFLVAFFGTEHPQTLFARVFVL